MNEQLIVDANEEGTQFQIACPFWANDLVRDMPNRKWVKSKRYWQAPVIRSNVVHVRGLAPMAGVVLTQRAEAALARHQAMSEGAGVRGAGFPTWYPFKRQPRAHQKRALDKGYGLKAYALFMDMQTGKTKTSIDLVSAHRMEGHIQAVLVLTKLSLRSNWANALTDDCPIPHSVHLPLTTKEKDFDRWLQMKHDFKVMIVGWESLSQGRMHELCRKFLSSHHPTAIIGDETNYIQEHKARVSQMSEEFARMAEYRYALTGTPAIEGPMKLYQQFQFLDPEIIGLGDYYAFRNRYATMGGYIPKEGPMKGKPVQIVGYQNVNELMDLIGPYSFQVMKTDEYDLPPKRYQVREIELTKEQRQVYNSIKKEAFIPMADGSEYALANTLEVGLRLHQVCGGYTVIGREEWSHDVHGNPKMKMTYDPVEIVPWDKNPKLIELMSILEDARHKQGIIWAVYRPEIEAIAKVLKHMGIKFGELHGGVPEKDRQPMVNAFAAGDLQFVVGNASTGGMGYTMMASELNVFYSNTFKARDRLQAEDRAWGDGQTKSGIWIDLIAAKSFDVTVYKAIKQKEDVHNYIRDRLKNVTKALCPVDKLLDGEST